MRKSECIVIVLVPPTSTLFLCGRWGDLSLSRGLGFALKGGRGGE